MVVRPTPSPSDQPLNLRPRGPLEMPQLHDKPRGQGCWECGSWTHHRKQCPERKQLPWQCTYCQSYSHHTPQCFCMRLDMSPPRTRTINKALNHTPHISGWCRKCLRNNPGHEEVDCPTRELCRNCRRCGNLYFLRTHKCDDINDQIMHNEGGEEGDPELYSRES